MAERAKKTPTYKVGDEVWIKVKITRLAPHPTLPEVTQVTVQLPSGHVDTMGLNEDKVRPVEPA